MKNGDQVFVHCGGRVNVVGTIIQFRDDNIIIRVENGAYDLHITVDNELKGSYNQKIGKFEAKS